MTEERSMKDGVQYTRHFTSMGDKPAVRKLIDQLIAEGFDFNRESAEWVKPGTGPNGEAEVRGRLSGSPDGTRAWLTASSFMIDDEPHIGRRLREATA